MIISFGSKHTQKIFKGEMSKNLPPEIQNIARRKLRMLNNAQDLMDLRIPPSNRLEKLIGQEQSYYSIRINLQWRIVFQWLDNNAHKVSIVDYH